MKKQVIGAAVSLATLLSTTLACAQGTEFQWYVGAGAATGTDVLNPTFQDQDTSTGLRLLLGQRWTENWGLELGYLDIGSESGSYPPNCLGDFCPAAVTSAAFDSEALTLGVTYQYPLGAWRPFAKLGVHRTSSAFVAIGAGDYNGTFLPGRQGHAEQLGLYGEIGAGFQISRQWQIRVGGEFYEFETGDSGNANLSILFGF